MSEPLPEFIRHIASMLPEMARGIRRKSIGGLGKRLVPTATCDICGKAHAHVSTSGTVPLPKTETCSECLKKLETLALIKASDNRYAFVKFKRLQPGQIVTVTNEDFDHIQKIHKSELHIQDLQRVLASQNCIDQQGNIIVENWTDSTWGILDDAGHNELEFDKCKCSKQC